MAMAMDYLEVDYCQEASSSINLVQNLVSERLVRLHLHQCEYLSSKMGETRNYLVAKSKYLSGIFSSDDVRRKALRQLHFTVKRAERLVRGCCCHFESSWLESATTLIVIKEDVVDLLLDLRWWTSMVDIAIANATWVTYDPKSEQEILEEAEKDFQTLLQELKSADNELEQAFVKDKKHLLGRVRKFLGSSTGQTRTHEYLLATHVRTRLENTDLVQSIADVDLNAHDTVGLIGMGTFGSVMNVKWLGRSCAMKILKYRCTDEAKSLSSFQHPHIVQFFRYWEAPFANDSLSPGSGTAMGGSPSPRTPDGATGDDIDPHKKSHILMERLPKDLAQHMHLSVPKAMPQDVAIDVMLQMAKAMWHLNNRDCAHRDLKPSNVLVQSVSSEDVPEVAARGYVRVKLGDFGLVNSMALSIASSMSAKNVGTRVYAAPEMFANFPRESTKFPRKADVWSFGIIFSEVLSGQPPFLFKQTQGMGELHIKIRKGDRPPLPQSCPEFLKFCITHCWQLRPQDRPSFADLWKLVRFAQVRSLGIIREDHDFFTFKTIEGEVKRLHKQKVTVPAPTPALAPAPADPRRSSVFWLMFVRLTLLFARKRSPSNQIKRQTSKAVLGAGSSTPRVEDKPLGYLVNLVGPQNATPDSSKRGEDSDKTKLDVIFFEGNVGRKKYLSCKDTWVQRGRPDVWWPRDWLQKDFNGNVRVLLLEYNISEKGIKGVVDELQKHLVFSDRWNRGHTWNRPIVLVGHSLGCVLIEQLVVALNERAELFGSLKDDFETKRARVSKAFLASLAGCFFYAPPYTGLVPSEDLLKHVFGGLTYSSDLFNDLCLSSPKLEELSKSFMEVRSKNVKLMALIEGVHTIGRTVVPAASMEGFEVGGGLVKELSDSNHSDTCKPIDNRHPAYKHLKEFIAGIFMEERSRGTSGDKQPVGLGLHSDLSVGRQKDISSLSFQES